MALLGALASGAAAQGVGGRTRVLVISGLSGEERFAKEYLELGRAVVDAARGRWGAAPEDVVWLAERPEADAARIAGRSTKAEIEKALVALSAAAPGDRVLVLLLGHGASTGETPTLSLPGPDMTAQELARGLAGVRAASVVVVNAADASGGFVPALSGRGRVVIAATRSGYERNETEFGRYFVAALTGDGADTDKDGRVSLLEAFAYARREVARSYAEGNRLLTEHAVLDDDADGKGSEAPGATGDGAVARRVFLDGGPAVKAAAGASPELRALYEQKARLERDVDALKARKAELPAAAYEKQLEALLVELAEKSQAIRRLEGGRP
ncbi:MAG TPA: hypothetical protein VFQ38_07675 [Longimicrobiales bacterium]|nr:hypothetical protein [Longimicrobiales bacterium]